jgi:hypothetical protein
MIADCSVSELSVATWLSILQKFVDLIEYAFENVNVVVAFVIVQNAC